MKSLSLTLAVLLGMLTVAQATNEAQKEPANKDQTLEVVDATASSEEAAPTAEKK